MAEKQSKQSIYLAERRAGLTYREIAEKYGVSHQAVSQSCYSRGPRARFKSYTPKEVVYPYWREWFNENRVTRRAFAEMLGISPKGSNMGTIAHWLRGQTFPQKKSIDKILSITGLTYEQLFAREGET